MQPQITFSKNAFYYQGETFLIFDKKAIETLSEIYAPEATTYEQMLNVTMAEKMLFSEKAYFTLVSIIAGYLAEDEDDD